MTYVNTQDISSGRIHKRYPTESGYATHEADNLDSAGAYRVLTETEFADLPEIDRCKRCYPEATAPQAADSDDDGSTSNEVAEE